MEVKTDLSDRELLELAAKAAGIKLEVNAKDYAVETLGYLTVVFTGGGLQFIPWNPLIDEGDALRLAVKLNLTIVNEPHECEVFSEGECIASEPILRLSMVATSSEVTDPCAATRRAIVRAAAELARKGAE